jgi:hypothetical protein
VALSLAQVALTNRNTLVQVEAGTPATQVALIKKLIQLAHLEAAANPTLEVSTRKKKQQVHPEAVLPAPGVLIRKSPQQGVVEVVKNKDAVCVLVGNGFNPLG